MDLSSICSRNKNSLWKWCSKKNHLTRGQMSENSSCIVITVQYWSTIQTDCKGRCKLAVQMAQYERPIKMVCAYGQCLLMTVCVGRTDCPCRKGIVVQCFYAVCTTTAYRHPYVWPVQRLCQIWKLWIRHHILDVFRICDVFCNYFVPLIPV